MSGFCTTSTLNQKCEDELRRRCDDNEDELHETIKVETKEEKKEEKTTQQESKNNSSRWTNDEPSMSEKSNKESISSDMSANTTKTGTKNMTSSVRVEPHLPVFTKHSPPHPTSSTPCLKLSAATSM